MRIGPVSSSARAHLCAGDWSDACPHSRRCADRSAGVVGQRRRGPSPAAGCCRCRGAPSRSRRAARRCRDASARRRPAPALLEADVARRRADQPRHRVLLHVLAHVEADELVAELQRELLGELGLADAGRPGEQETAGRALGRASPARERLMACATRCTASFCPKTTRSSDSSSVRSRSRSEADACRAGMRAMRAAIGSMSGGVDRHRRRRGAARDSSSADDGAGFVDEIDRAVGQADSRAGGAPPVSRRPRAPRPCTSRGGAPRSGCAGRRESARFLRPTVRRWRSSAAGARARGPSRCA